MRTSIISTTAAIALLSAPLFAAEDGEWVQYAEGANDTKLFIKPSMAKKMGNIWYVWIKQVPRQPELVDAQNPKGKKWSYALSRQAVSCGDQALSGMSRIEYDASGTSLGSYDFPMNLKSVIPDSVGETLVNVVCKYLDARQ